MSLRDTFDTLAVVEQLNERTGADLGTQVWLARHEGPEAEGSPVPGPDPAKFKPIRRNEPPRWKPREGGLWTAQWDETYGGGWAQWCISEGFEVPEGRTWPHVWLLEPEPAARVLVIDSYNDLARIYERWPHPMDEGYTWREGYPAWEQVAEHYDAVHVTEEGQWRTRLSQPLSLYGWDCESTLWFRWAFTDTRHIGPRTFEERPYDT